MKKLLFILPITLSISLLSCDIDKKGKTELPEVDVDVDYEKGNLPEFDVDWAEVNVGTKTEMVKVPKIKVVMEEEEIEVPYVDVDMPNEDKEEITLAVEAEIDDVEHKLSISEIKASNKRLFVISKLEKLTQDLGDETIRIQDQVKLNAPDLDVKHYIIGNRIDRDFNTRYKYVNSYSALPDYVKNAKTIFKR